MPAPKFASFRPKPEILAEHQTSVAHSQPEKRDIKHEATRRSLKNASHQTSREDSHAVSLAATPKTSVFFEDRKGDSGNITFGLNDSSKVPTYRPPPERRLVGDTRFHAPKKSSLTHLDIHARRSLKVEGLFIGQELASKVERESLSNSSYVSIQSSSRQKRRKVEAKQALDIQPEQDGQSLSSSESGLEDDETFQQDPTLPYRLRHTRLEKQARSNPLNVNAWLEYVRFQDEWVLHGLGSTRTSTKSTHRTVMELKLQICAEALQQIPSDNDDVHQLLGYYVFVGQAAWSAEEVAKQWEGLMKKYQNNPRVWSDYITYIQTSPDFDFDTCRGLHLERLQMLTERLVAKGGSSCIDDALEGFLESTCFVRDAGFAELSTALWQAILELVVFSPPSLSWNQKLEAFEKFWDDERPRLGESGGVGWMNSPSQKSESQVAEPPPIKQIETLRQWSDLELAGMRYGHLPGRASTQSEEDEDLFQVVLFSDVEPFIGIAQHIPPDTRIIDAFLTFNKLSGLPVRNGSNPSPSTNQQNERWLQQSTVLEIESDDLSRSTLLDLDSFVNLRSTLGNMLRAKRNSRVPAWSNMFVENLAEQMLMSAAMVEHWPTLTRAGLTIYQSKPERKARAMLKRDTANIELYNFYALLQLKSAADKLSDHRDTATALKTLSSALQLKDSLSQDRQKDAVFVWHTQFWLALESDDVRQLLVCAQSILPASGDAASQMTPIFAQEIATAQEALHQIFIEDLKTNNDHRAAVSVSVSIILGYGHALHYRAGRNKDPLSVALELFRIYFARLTNSRHALALELLHQEQAGLVRNHLALDTNVGRSKAHQPEQILQALRKSVSAFPNNTILARTMNSLTVRNGLAFDAVRSALSEASSDTDNTYPEDESLTSAVCRLHALLQLWAQHQDGTSGAASEDPSSSSTLAVQINTIRKSFERGLKSHFVRRAAIVWTTYFLFEICELRRQIRKGEKKTEIKKQAQRAKSIYYRGCRAMPWNKTFIMLAFHVTYERVADGGSLVFEEQELRSIYQEMDRKGLRIRRRMN